MAELVKTPLRMTAREFVTCLAVMAHSAKVAFAFVVEPIQGEVARCDRLTARSALAG